MFKLLDTLPWMLLALATGAVCALRLSAGDMPLPAMIVCAVAMMSALHRPTREAVVRGLLRLFSGSTLRALVLVIGAVMLIQLLPLEMGLLLAGDILVYLEAVAAVTLIAANTRLRPLVSVARSWLRAGMLSARIRRPARRQRRPRPVRPPKISDDSDRPAWAYA